MNRFIITFTCAFVLLQGCASWAEMGRTGEPPVAWSNQYRAIITITELGVCGNQVGAGIINTSLDTFIPFTSNFDPVCTDTSQISAQE